MKIPGLNAISQIINEAILNVYHDFNDKTDRAAHLIDITKKVTNDYLKYIEYEAKYATLIGHEDPVQVKDIFVEPELDRPFKISDDQPNAKHLLITAPPGAGKSTLAKYICLVGCGYISKTGHHRLRKFHYFVEGKIPFYVTARDIPLDDPFSLNFDWRNTLGKRYEKYFDNISDEIRKKPISFLEFLMSRLLERIDVKYPFSFIDYLLRKGKICLIVDGIDETSEQIKENILNSFNHIAAAYPNNNLIAFARPKALPDGIYGFRGLNFLPFNQPKWEQFIDFWFGSEESKKRELKQLINDNEYFQDLCQTPLLVSILCVLMDRGYQIPRRKSDLYRRCVDALLSEFDRSKRLRRPTKYEGINEQSRLDILSKIAFQMHLNSRQEARLREIEEYLKDKSFIRKIIEEDGLHCLLDLLELEHGILVEKTKGVYAFPHRTFQEFLTAWYIERTRKENWFVDALRKQLKNNQEQWREVAIILAHLLFDPTEYIKNLTNFAFPYKFKQSLLEEILSQDLFCDIDTYNYVKQRLSS